MLDVGAARRRSARLTSARRVLRVLERVGDDDRDRLIGVEDLVVLQDLQDAVDRASACCRAPGSFGAFSCVSTASTPGRALAARGVDRRDAARVATALPTITACATFATATSAA